MYIYRNYTNCFWRSQVCSKLVFPIYGKLSSPEKSCGVEPRLPHPAIVTERKYRLVTDNAEISLNSENTRYLSLLKAVEFLEKARK